MVTKTIYKKLRDLLFMTCAAVIIISTSTSAVFASAPTTYYQPRTIEEFISYLYGMIYQLQAQLDAQGGTSRPINNLPPSRPTTGGTAVSYALSVRTLPVTSVNRFDARLRGEVDLNRSDYSYVWFEYGETTRVNQRTGRVRVTDSQGDIRAFSERVTDLDRDEKYYYRAVAENARGQLFYGDLRSFSTDYDNRYDDGNYDNNNGSDTGNVTTGNASLRLSQSRINRGELVSVSWTMDTNLTSDSNWVGIYPRSAADATPQAYKYISNDRTGTITFTPSQTGIYEFRLFKNDRFNRLAVSPTLEVR